MANFKAKQIYILQRIYTIYYTGDLLVYWRLYWCDSESQLLWTFQTLLTWLCWLCWVELLGKGRILIRCLGGAHRVHFEHSLLHDSVTAIREYLIRQLFMRKREKKGNFISFSHSQYFIIAFLLSWLWIALAISKPSSFSLRNIEKGSMRD